MRPDKNERFQVGDIIFLDRGGSRMLGWVTGTKRLYSDSPRYHMQWWWHERHGEYTQSNTGLTDLGLFKIGTLEEVGMYVERGVLRMWADL